MNGGPLVTLLTDFGDRDYYVAAVKGTLLRLAPGCRLVDLSHAVEPGNVGHGAFLLAAAAPTFPPGTIHLAVVDPGVGSRRRILAAAADDQVFVGPDNGLLAPCLAARAEPEVRAVQRDQLFLAGPGRTFHGRDRFAPVAAYLARGEALADLGPVIDDPVRPTVAPPERRSDRLFGRVVHVDRFGNIVTDLPWEWLPHGAARVTIGTLQTSARCSHYDEIGDGEAAMLCGSLGTLEVSMRAASAASSWRIAPGEPVQVDFG